MKEKHPVEQEKHSEIFQPSDAAKDFLLQEYRSLFEYHQANKDVGDTRMASFMTITGVVITALIAVQQFLVPETRPILMVFCCGALLSFGLLTYRKMLQRRSATIVARRRMAHIRIWFLNRYPELADGMVYGINENMLLDWGKYKIGTTARTIALINCFLLLLPVLWLTIQFVSGYTWFGVAILACAIGAFGWFGHILWKLQFFKEAEKLDEHEQAELAAMKDKFFVHKQSTNHAREEY